MSFRVLGEGLARDPRWRSPGPKTANRVARLNQISSPRSSASSSIWRTGRRGDPHGDGMKPQQQSGNLLQERIVKVACDPLPLGHLRRQSRMNRPRQLLQPEQIQQGERCKRGEPGRASGTIAFDRTSGERRIPPRSTRPSKHRCCQRPRSAKVVQSRAPSFG